MVKKIISIVLIFLVLIITSMTIYKLIIRHNNKLYNVLYSEIKYKANRCYLEEKCKSSMRLSDLYEKGYLDIMYDPVTKEELNKNLEIEILNNEIIIKNN